MRGHFHLCNLEQTHADKEIAEMADKYISSCRGCLTKLGSEDSHSFVWPEIRELFEDCTSIKIPDDQILPRQICSECLSKCEQWHAFKRMCHDINDHLQGLIAKDDETKTTIKDECAEKEKQMNIKEECVEKDQQTNIKEEFIEKDDIPCSDVEEDDDMDQYTFGKLVVDTDEEDESWDRTQILEDGSANMSDMTGSAESLASKEEPTVNENHKGPINCPVCHKRMCSRSALHIHFVKHTDERPYQCTYCKDDFTTKSAAMAHKHIEHPDLPTEDAVSLKKDSIFQSKRPWEEIDCSTQEIPQKTKILQRRGVGDVKPKGTSPQQTGRYCYVNCPVCQQLMHRAYLKTHFVVHTKELPYVCSYCNEDFTFKKKAKLHVLTKHPGESVDNGGIVVKKGSIFESPRPWEAMGYSIESDEYRVNRRTDKDAPTNVEESVLGENAVSRKDRYQEAKQSSIDASDEEWEPSQRTSDDKTRNVKCPVCQHVMQRGNLKAHFVVHTKERPYMCTYCNEDFTSKQIAKHHVLAKHPGKPADDSGLVVKSGSIFESTRPWEAMGYSLEMHRKPRRSDEEKQADTKYVYVKCPVCKKLLQKSNLKGHFVVHTNERPYVCTHCDTDFRYKQIASNHVQNKHPGHSTVDGGVVIKKGSIFESLRPWEAMGYKIDEISKEGHAEDHETTRKAEKILFCPLCEKTFSRKKYLKEHIFNHQRGDMDPQVESSSKGN